MKMPYLTSASTIVNDSFSKLLPPSNTPTSGIIILSTSEETILPNAPPITTATAKSSTFPLIANFLNSSHILTQLLIKNRTIILYDNTILINLSFRIYEIGSFRYFLIDKEHYPP